MVVSSEDKCNEWNDQRIGKGMTCMLGKDSCNTYNTHTHTHTHIYIYIEREREKERVRRFGNLCFGIGFGFFP